MCTYNNLISINIHKYLYENKYLWSIYNNSSEYESRDTKSLSNEGL